MRNYGKLRETTENYGKVRETTETDSTEYLDSLQVVEGFP